MAETEEVSTTRLTPACLAAVRTLSVPLIAGSKSSFCRQQKHKLDFSTNNHFKKKLNCGWRYLGVLDLVDDARRGEVEDAGAAVDCGGDGIVVEEVDLEEAEARLCSFQGF